MDDVSERWLPVVDWEGRYEVSDQGRVRSLPGRTQRSRRIGKTLKPRMLPTGYARVSLYDGSRKQRDRYVHDLVTEAFLGPRPAGTEVLHGPGGTGDNRLVNLSYGTHLANCDDRTRDGRYHFKLTRALAAEIRTRHSAGETQKALAAEYGVQPPAISRIVNGHRWAA